MYDIIFFEVIQMSLLSMVFGKAYKDVDSEQLKEMFKEKGKYQFLDVRTKQEYKHKRVREFDKNIDYYKFVRNASMLERINMDKPVVVMCQTGSRSNGACHLLVKMGHKEVYNFKRGINNWNGPTVK